MFRTNTRFQIKTPSGFRDFKGIQKLVKQTHHHIIFEDGGELKVSENHTFGTERIKPSFLTPGYVLDGRVITYNEVVEEPIDLYDLVEVDGGNVYYGSNIVQHNCDFVGSVGTLINSAKLKSLVYEEPLVSSGGLDIYEHEIHKDENDENSREHEYMITVDVSRGMKLDYSAFLVFDITQYPHKLVAKYRNNEIKPMLFPDVIVPVAKKYNNAWILCEVNDIGDQVASIIFYDMEYPNLLMTSMRGRAGQVLGHGFSGGKTQLGLKMAKAPKKLGASNMKQMVESDKVVFQDFQLINELTTFIEKRGSFEAQDGCNDDLVMCLHRTSRITTEDGIKTIKWIVDNKYTGKVLSLDETGRMVWSRVIAHSSLPNKSKRWIQIKGNSRNTLSCTTDHKVATIDDIFDPKVTFIEAQDMLGKYNVVLPGNRFHKSNPLFNKQQISVLVGSMLGDSSISSCGQLICVHSIAQKDYAIHKHSIFKGSCKENQPRGKSKTSYTVRGITNAHTHKIRELMYDNGTKTISNIIDLVDDISLAYWYMDDGYLKSNSALLCTDSFTYEEHITLVDMLWNKFGVKATITTNTNCRTNKIYYRILIGVDGRDKFFDIISPYIIDSMKYKLPEKYRSIETKTIDTNCLDFGAEMITKIKDIPTGRGRGGNLYDITVEDTHTFISNGMVVHNCLLIYAWACAQDYFKEMTDQSIRQELYEKDKDTLEEDMSPFGFIVDGIDNDMNIDSDGTIWQKVEMDEYGTPAGNWQWGQADPTWWG